MYSMRSSLSLNDGWKLLLSPRLPFEVFVRFEQSDNEHDRSNIVQVLMDGLDAGQVDAAQETDQIIAEETTVRLLELHHHVDSVKQVVLLRKCAGSAVVEKLIKSSYLDSVDEHEVCETGVDDAFALLNPSHRHVQEGFFQGFVRCAYLD